jgi:murein DD-endopeptidase MepM/ murein hydrolase activator NlpD
MSFRSLPSRATLLVFIFLTFVIGVGVVVMAPHNASADAASDIQAQIDAQNKKISDLTSEIAGYQKQLNVVSGQKQTLQTAISSIDISRKQTQTQVQVTQTKLSATNLTLVQLGHDIATKEQIIQLDQNTVGKSMRDLQASDETSLIERVLSSNSFSAAWSDADKLASINGVLRANIDTLNGVKRDLSGKQDDAQASRDKLASLQKELVTQQKALDANKAAKQSLLTQTKSTESTYQALITQKKAQQKSFESELSRLESSLKPVTASVIPHVGQGILAFPFSASFAAACVGKSAALGNNYCITQYFGNTPFATANPQIYNGSGHNAIDIGMPVGTPILAALSGTVLATGNTDLAHDANGRQCLSFGKYVVIKHANGLDTLYAHLSVINVSTGQSLSTGDAVGFSGMTGYATGPHLHFGVYASSGVKITTLGLDRGATTPCQNASIPISPPSGYLNPMSYL